MLILLEATSLERSLSHHGFGGVRDHSASYLMRKKTISTPLMIEKPVMSLMVPPMRLSWASVLIFLSLSMSSKVAVSKYRVSPKKILHSDLVLIAASAALL